MVRRIHVERAGSVNSADLQDGGDPRGQGIQLQRLTSALYQPEIGLSHGLGDGELLLLGHELDVGETSMKLVHDVSSCKAEAIDYCVHLPPGWLEAVLLTTP